jgi:cytochrome P450
MAKYLTELITWRRADPRDDLISAMAHSRGGNAAVAGRG